jgi:uncharacterized protein
MNGSNGGERSKKRIADIFVDHSRSLLALVILISVVLASSIYWLERDPSFKSIFSASSPEYQKHRQVVQAFGDDEAIIVAIKNETGWNDQLFLSALDSLTQQLAKIDKIAEVVSITNLQCLQKVGEEVGSFPLVSRAGEVLVFPDPLTLEGVRKAMPVMDLLLSPDLKTVGVLIHVRERWRLDLDACQEIVSAIGVLIKSKLPQGTEYRIVGPALIRQALQKYTTQTAVIFGALCALICTAASIYVFKSLKVTLVTGLILGLSGLWTVGLMPLLGIPLNPTTSTAFGLILITSLEIVIHMVVRYNQFRQFEEDRIDAVRETVRYLARPCVMCAATTAVGFGTCMVSNIPMVFQLGLIMAVGIMVSCGLALILTPALIMATKTLDTESHDRMIGDALTPLLERLKWSIARHFRLYTVAGFAIAAFMFSGTQFIRTDHQFLRFLGDSNSEVKDIAFVEENLASFHELELVMESEPNTFKKPQVWKKIMELEQRLKLLPEVVATDSLLPFLERAHSLLGRQASNPDDLFTNPRLIPQLLFLTSLRPDGKRMLRRYAVEDFGKIRVFVRIKNSPSIPLGETVGQVRFTADSIMKGIATTTITGELAVFLAQGQDLVKSEIYSMLLALGLITILLMIQMGTPLFGLISLVPNIPPIASVFGVMGWFGMSLDSATVFAATVAVGLAADNTIHYVAQLKREIRLNPQLGVEECVFRAYSLAAKPMAAWSIVTLLGFLALTVTPFRACYNFGVLVSVAVFMGMFGDLVFMQSIILTSSFVRRLLTKLIDKEISGQIRRNPSDNLDK